MDTYLYLYLFLFILSIYFIVDFNNRIKVKFPKSYNLLHKNNLQFYPTNYNSQSLFQNENKYWNSIKSELMIFYTIIKFIFTPIIKIIYYPKKILFNYINDQRLY